MATVKAYTDLEQSKKLTKILPLESADMYYDGYGRLPQGYAYTLIFPNSFEYDKPAWSLSALLKILPKSIRLTQDMRNCYDNPIYKGEKYKFELKRCGFLSDEWYIQYCGGQERQYGKRYYHNAPVELHVTKKYDNPVDACVEMIEKLNELKML